MRALSALTCLTVACVTVVVGSIGVAAPCKGSANAAAPSHRSHVVRQAVVHERVIASHEVRQVAYAEPQKDIVDTAVGAGTFKTLAAALGAAELVATLKGDGPFTVFAPTDEAFAKLPAGTVENLLKPENKEKLKEILLLHVVPGTVYAADVVKLTEAKTAGGKVVKVATEGGVKVGTSTGLANVIKTDIKAKNGVIHVIDAVILP
jgi:uncharacterized surface protein with fasciclin (FAS1) repeats